MAGLFGDVLPSIFSTANTVKKNLKGAIKDPLGLLSSLGQDFQTANAERSQAVETMLRSSDPAAKQQAMALMTEQASDMTGAGLIKRAPAALAQKYEELAKRLPEKEIWEQSKVFKAPDGQHYTESTLKAISVAKLPTTKADAVPAKNVLSYMTDDPEIEKLLDQVKIYRMSGTRGYGQLKKEADGFFYLGVDPSKGPMEQTIYHELGHAIRTGLSPASIGPGNLLGLNQRLINTFADLQSTLEAKKAGGLKEWAAKSRIAKAEAQGNKALGEMWNMSPEQIQQRMAQIRSQLNAMDKHVDSAGNYSPQKHYLAQQDEQMSRLDEWRSGMSDQEQREWFPKGQTLMEPLSPDYTDILDWEKAFKD